MQNKRAILLVFLPVRGVAERVTYRGQRPFPRLADEQNPARSDALILHRALTEKPPQALTEAALGILGSIPIYKRTFLTREGHGIGWLIRQNSPRPRCD